MKQYGRQQKDNTPSADERIASALERIADCFDRLLEMAEKEKKNGREGQG